MKICQLAFVFITSVFCLIGGCSTGVGIDGDKSSILPPGNDLFYLSNHKIYRIGSENDKAELIYAAPKRQQPDGSFQLNALKCGPGKTLMFHQIFTSRMLSSGDMEHRVRIKTYNPATMKLESLADLDNTWTAFPVLSRDGSKLAMVDGASVLVKNLKNGLLEHYGEFKEGWAFPWSWSPDSKVLALSGATKMGEAPRIYFLNTETHVLTPWAEGIMPFISRTGNLIAYSSSDNRHLIIADRLGKTVQSFTGHVFKEIGGWIDDDRVIFIDSLGRYKNNIGVANLKTEKIHLIRVPTSGEINGVCLMKKSDSGEFKFSGTLGTSIK